MINNLEEKPELPFNNLYLNSGIVNGKNEWWMYVVTIILLTIGYIGFGSLFTIPLVAKAINNGVSLEQINANNNIIFNSEVVGLDRNIILLLQFGLFVFAAIGFYIGIKRIHQKPFMSILTGYEKFRFKKFWTAFIIWGTLLIITVVISYFMKPESLKFNFNLSGFLISLLLMLIFMPIQTGLEEVLFRGYLMQGISQVFKNGIIPLIITSLLFGLAHMSNPEVKQYGWPIMLSYYCGFALFMGAVTLLDEGLELAFGIHFANNIISSILINSEHSVIKTYSVFESKTEDPIGEMILWLCMSVITFTIFWLKYRWKNLNLILK